MARHTSRALQDIELTDHIRGIVDRLEESTADLETCVSLPPEVYTSEAWFEFEKRAVWDREWICVAHVGHVPQIGDYTAVTVNDDPLLVLRSSDGEVRVMSAVCQHRGHLLGESSGNTQMFTCPFHGWSYDLTGRLVSAPEMKPHASLDELQKTHCLPSLRVEIWNGFIFVNIHGDAPPLGPRLKRLSGEIANHHLGEMGATPTMDWPGNPWNWKFMHENAIEPHHTAYLHKGPHDFAPSHLASFVDWDEEDDGAVFHPTGFVTRDANFTAEFRCLFPIIETLTDKERQRVMFACVLPNLFFGCVPDGCFYYLILPEGANAITIRVGLLYPHATFRMNGFENILNSVIEGISIYNDQDTVANTAVHKGLRSRFANRGRYAPKEATLPQMNRWLVKRYREYAEEISTGTSQ